MYEFSVEQAANKIHDHRTREHFKEVMNNYFNGNYRSATVMLWTVVICDLVFKLQYLKEIHNDTKAKSILDDMVDYQTKNPNNPIWEINLLKELYNRTSFLEAHELDALETLQKHRHLSAHPVINKTNILFKPNREMTLSDIRISLDSVLTKPPILTKQVFEELLEDLEKIKDLFPANAQLKRYLLSKYFSNLNDEVSTHILKSLWRITFKVENERCNKNREINYRALDVLFGCNRELYTEYIKNNSPYFSEISDGSPLRRAIFFLGDYPQVFELLSEAAREVIQVKAHTNIDLLAVSYFVSNNISDHIALLIEKINNEFDCAFGSSNSINQNHIKDLKKHAVSAGVDEQLNKLLVTMYINSTDFDSADSQFRLFIKPNLNKFTSQDVQELIEGISNNNQTHWRSRANSDHLLVVDRANEVIENFEVTEFPCLPRINNENTGD